MIRTALIRCGGFLVSETVANEAWSTWPHRPEPDCTDQEWLEHCREHVRRIALKHGEQPQAAP